LEYYEETKPDIAGDTAEWVSPPLRIQEGKGSNLGPSLGILTELPRGCSSPPPYVNSGLVLQIRSTMFPSLFFLVDYSLIFLSCDALQSSY
jgi:hypothetical protein